MAVNFTAIFNIYTLKIYIYNTFKSFSLSSHGALECLLHYIL